MRLVVQICSSDSVNIPIFAAGINLNTVIESEIYDRYDRLLLENCTLCPRECRVNRFDGETGYCGSDAGLNISHICIHRGEEPVIGGKDGICNIFFAGCNLHCIYCQNHEISHCRSIKGNSGSSLDEVLDHIIELLSEGINAVGFVSPSHVVPQVKAIIRGLKLRGHLPVTVYNTNGYEKVETIKSLSGLIDIYLPDYKYVTRGIAGEYSDASDYPEITLKAIKEMYYQKGSTLITDDYGRVRSGLIIRHLVLPGHSDESRKVLRSIAEELSPGVHLSIMSQYHPIEQIRDHPVLNRILYNEEYESVISGMEALGFRNGWIQNLDSHLNYRPDFRRENPFEGPPTPLKGS